MFNAQSEDFSEICSFTELSIYQHYVQTYIYQSRFWCHVSLLLLRHLCRADSMLNWLLVSLEFKFILTQLFFFLLVLTLSNKWSLEKVLVSFRSEEQGKKCLRNTFLSKELQLSWLFELFSECKLSEQYEWPHSSLFLQSSQVKHAEGMWRVLSLISQLSDLSAGSFLLLTSFETEMVFFDVWLSYAQFF